MTPNEMLKQAKAIQADEGLGAYLDAILELRRKGSSYRQIAEFLKERGVATDHTAVFRLVAIANPLLQAEDGYVLLADGVLYESRPGRPLRPYRAGCLVHIERKLAILPLEVGASKSIWCEAQFLLNEVPNQVWLQKLADYLGLTWNHSNPTASKGRNGFELKFGGNVMAMVCKTYNLEQEVPTLAKAVAAVSASFIKDKTWLAKQEELARRRDKEILDSLLIPRGMSPKTELQNCLDGGRQEVEELAKTFQSILIS